MATIRQVAEAFVAGEVAQCHNATTDGVEYRLHGHRIAQHYGDGALGGRGVEFNWCGWHTPTTANHINNILDAMHTGKRVSYAAARDEKAPRIFAVGSP